MKKPNEHPRRAKFKDILCEFLPSAKRSRRVIVLLGGMPGYPRRNELMHKLAAMGYWVFNPRYRGSWESGGLMFAKPVEKDVFDLLDGIEKGFTDLWSGERYAFKPDRTVLWGSSLGGAAAILASTDKRITDVIALAPLIDWQDDSEDEPLDRFIPYLTRAFGPAYRFHPKGWDKIRSGRFFSPAAAADKMDGKKITIVHAKDDSTCPFASSERFALRTGASMHKLKTGGHMLSYDDPKIKRIINSVLRK